MRFSVVFALQNIFKHKKRSFAIVVGFLIGVCMVTAFLTWADAATLVFAKDHLGRDFQLVAERDAWETTGLLPADTFNETISSEPYNKTLLIHDSIQRDPLVGRIEAVYSTFGHFNTEDKKDSYTWYSFPEPLGTVEEEPVLNASVFIVNESFLELFLDELNLVGSINMDKNSVLMSRNLIAQINKTIGIQYGVGSNLDYAIATRLVESIYSPGVATLGYWDRVFFENVTVVGTYDWDTRNSYIADSLRKELCIFRFEMREFWLAPILTWPISLENSMFVPFSQVDEDTLVKLAQFRPPTTFVQVNPEEVAGRGITNLDEEISKLEARISYMDSEMNVRPLHHVWEFIDAYTQSLTLLIYVVPVVGLSVCMIILGSEVTFKERKKEVGILRSKGATYRQLFVIYVVELLTLIFIGSVLGFLPGIFLGCAIPATTGFFQYDLSIFREFLSSITISPYTFVFSLATCGTVPLVYALYKANSYAKTEVIKAMEPGIREGEERESSAPYLILMVIILGVFLGSEVYSMALSIFGFSTTRENILFYVLFIAQWMAFGCFFALVLTRVLPKLSRVFAFVLKTRSKLVTLDLRRQKIFTSLTVVLILVSSIMVFSLVESETINSNLMNEIRYAIGTDLRITTKSDQPISFAQNLTGNFTMLETVMPVLSTYGSLAGSSMRIIGVDPLQYRDLAFWTSWSFVSPTYERALVSLAADPEGVILGHYITYALRRDLGDELRTSLQGKYQKFKIVGIMRSAPGFGEAEPFKGARKSLGFQEDKEDRLVIVNKQLLIDKGINMTSLFFASLKAEADEIEACEKLSELPEVDAVYSSATFDLSEVDIYRFLHMQGVTGILILQFLAATLIGIVSLILYLDYIVSGRSVEYAVYRAVGATRKNVRALIFVESVEVVVLSLLIGSFLGIMYSEFLSGLLLRIFPFRSLVPFVFVVPIQTILVGLGVVLLAMIIGSYLPARKAGRTDVARVLRNL